MMIDSLYLKSLFSTFFIYVTIVGLLISFVIVTGITGFLLIFSVIVLLVIYFYGGFARRDLKGKGFRS